MSELDHALNRLRSHDGVQHVLLLGRDGLLIRHLADEGLDSETVAAMIPEIVFAGGSLGSAADRGELSTVVMEFGRGVGIVVTLSADLLLAVLVEPDTGFAALLAELRRERGHLAQLV